MPGEPELERRHVPARRRRGCSVRLPYDGPPRRPSALLVAAPATPSAARPLRAWNRRTAARVPGAGDSVDRLLVEADAAQRDLQRRDLGARRRRWAGAGSGGQEREGEQRSWPHRVVVAL